MKFRLLTFFLMPLLFLLSADLAFRYAFAKKIKRDFANFESQVTLTTPFIVKHTVIFSSVERVEYSYVVLFGYSHLYEKELTLGDHW
jgi:hypothetical protein